MSTPLFEVKDVDREFYETRLRDWLPERMIDIHVHLWLDRFRRHAPGEFARVVSWPMRVARENSIPFYVAAPMATIDPGCRTGADIPIEERGAEEVSCMFGVDSEGRPASVRIAPAGSPVRNPAFDVTPARYVTAIITERGIFPPSEIRRVLDG